MSTLAPIVYAPELREALHALALMSDHVRDLAGHRYKPVHDMSENQRRATIIRPMNLQSDVNVNIYYLSIGKPWRAKFYKPSHPSPNLLATARTVGCPVVLHWCEPSGACRERMPPLPFGLSLPESSSAHGNPEEGTFNPTQDGYVVHDPASDAFYCYTHSTHTIPVPGTRLWRGAKKRQREDDTDAPLPAPKRRHQSPEPVEIPAPGLAIDKFGSAGDEEGQWTTTADETPHGLPDQAEDEHPFVYAEDAPDDANLRPLVYAEEPDFNPLGAGFMPPAPPPLPDEPASPRPPAIEVEPAVVISTLREANAYTMACFHYEAEQLRAAHEDSAAAIKASMEPTFRDVAMVALVPHVNTLVPLPAGRFADLKPLRHCIKCRQPHWTWLADLTDACVSCDATCPACHMTHLTKLLCRQRALTPRAALAHLAETSEMLVKAWNQAEEQTVGCRFGKHDTQ